MAKCRCSKNSYRTQLGAIKACVKMQTKYGKNFYWYRCGNIYHITKSKNNHSGLIKPLTSY